MFQSSGYLVGEPGSKKDRVCNVLATGLRVATRQNFMLRVPVLGVFCRGTWMKEGRSLLCAGYASTCGYASKSKLRVPVLGVFCRGAWIIEGGSLCAGYASMRQN